MFFKKAMCTENSGYVPITNRTSESHVFLKYANIIKAKVASARRYQSEYYIFLYKLIANHIDNLVFRKQYFKHYTS